MLGAILWASSARAQVPGEEIARRAFEDGVALEKKGDYAGALAKFKESEQIKATLGNRYHKAYCLEMTGKLAAALLEYEIVDKSAREANKAELVEATRLRIEPLRVKVPQLSLKLAGTPPAGAEVALDGTSIPLALLDGKAFRVDPGEHVVTAQAPEHDAFKKGLTAAEGTTTSVEIVLTKATTTATARGGAGAERLTEPPAEAPRRSLALPILTTAGAVVLAAGGVVAYVLADGAQADLEKTCATKPSCEDDKATTRTLDALALGGFIGAAGLAALSVVLWTSSSSAPAESAGGATASARPRATASATTARLVVRSSWLGLEGRF
ncbi:MAG: hypothetical protein KF795_31740 [Labilithrix sp.]|nr:hypothetical protein [Labilithrix sp.]